MHLEWLVVDGGGGPLARGGRGEACWGVQGGGGRRGRNGLATLSGHEVPDEDSIPTADDSATV